MRASTRRFSRRCYSRVHFTPKPRYGRVYFCDSRILKSSENNNDCERDSEPLSSNFRMRCSIMSVDGLAPSIVHRAEAKIAIDESSRICIWYEMHACDCHWHHYFFMSPMTCTKLTMKSVCHMLSPILGITPWKRPSGPCSLRTSWNTPSILRAD